MLKNDCSLHAYMYDHGPRIRMLNDDRRFYTGTKCVYRKPVKIFVRKDTRFLYMTICRHWNHFDRRRRLHAADTRADLRVHACCGQGHVWAQGTLGKHTLGNCVKLTHILHFLATPCPYFERFKHTLEFKVLKLYSKVSACYINLYGCWNGHYSKSF